MTKRKQSALVRDLARNLAKGILDSIQHDMIPESWDGHELRVLFSMAAENSARMSTIKREPHRRRARDFRNLVLVRNL